MMQEKIGNVTLDLFWYSGRDEYSDGPVEDELLEIARSTREENLNQVIAEKKDWACLYHFSEIRQNIISWLPIEKYDHVLEIGSGCGAIRRRANPAAAGWMPHATPNTQSATEPYA